MRQLIFDAEKQTLNHATKLNDYMQYASAIFIRLDIHGSE